MNIFTLPTEIHSFILFLLTNVLTVSRFGLKCLLNALNVNVNENITGYHPGSWKGDVLGTDDVAKRVGIHEVGNGTQPRGTLHVTGLSPDVCSPIVTMSTGTIQLLSTLQTSPTGQPPLSP